MVARMPPPLLRAVEMLLARRDASVVWLDRSEQLECLARNRDPSQEWPGADGTSPDAMILDGNEWASANELGALLEMTEGTDSAADTLCVVVDHDSEQSLWSTVMSSTLGSQPDVASIAEVLEDASYRIARILWSPRRSREAEGYFASDSGLVTLSRSASPIKRFGAALGLNRIKYSSTAIVAHRNHERSLPVLTLIANWLEDNDLYESADELNLMGFQLRSRGSFLLFVSGTQRGEFVAKFSLRPEADGRVQNGYQLQTRLRDKLTGSAREVVPTPYLFKEKSSSSDRVVCLEELKSGVIAWKVNTGRKSRRIEGDALTFLEQLQRQTRTELDCDSDVLRGLLTPTIEAAQRAELSDGRLASALSRLARCIDSSYRNRHVSLVTSHGDFGIGNVLVDPRTGELTAVIDWADGRRLDFPSVDPMNWAIQQRRDRRDLSFVEAARELHTDMVQKGAALNGMANEEQWAGKGLVPLLVAVYRYVGRSLSYPWTFRHECGSPETVSRYINSLCDDWKQE